MIHTFKKLEDALAAVQADNAIDYSVSNKQPSFADGDLIAADTRFGLLMFVVQHGMIHLPSESSDDEEHAAYLNVPCTFDAALVRLASTETRRRQKAVDDRISQKRANESVITDELIKALRPFCPTASADPEKPVHLDICMGGDFTADRAKEVVAGFRAIGLW